MAEFHHRVAALAALFFLLCAIAATTSNRTAAPAGNDEYDDDVQRRKAALSRAIDVLRDYRHGTSDPETLMRARAVVNREVQRHWRPIFENLKKVWNSGADERTKAEALAAAKELLNRELGHGPNAVKIDFRFA